MASITTVSIAGASAQAAPVRPVQEARPQPQSGREVNQAREREVSNSAARSSDQQQLTRKAEERQPVRERQTNQSDRDGPQERDIAVRREAQSENESGGRLNTVA